MNEEQKSHQNSKKHQGNNGGNHHKNGFRKNENSKKRQFHDQRRQHHRQGNMKVFSAHKPPPPLRDHHESAPIGIRNHSMGFKKKPLSKNFKLAIEQPTTPHNTTQFVVAKGSSFTEPYVCEYAQIPNDLNFDECYGSMLSLLAHNKPSAEKLVLSPIKRERTFSVNLDDHFSPKSLWLDSQNSHDENNTSFEQLRLVRSNSCDLRSSSDMQTLIEHLRKEAREKDEMINKLKLELEKKSPSGKEEPNNTREDPKEQLCICLLCFMCYLFFHHSIFHHFVSLALQQLLCVFCVQILPSCICFFLRE
eukprot:TRINITY_DN5903_c0_g1_i2.p1 TRINITY_DN5903_c0_g1~~TRINITY_DN5903_c0_g1_i2.p1  ORF type:complete len:306 (-),score=36.28 TRINITY_DN5903_c0_g1_i2:178-1095(-)